MDRLTDQLGYLILQVDGTVHCSYGELANNEHVANLISNLVTIAKNIPPQEEKYKKISVIYPDAVYVICLSNARIHISKLRRRPQTSETDSDPTGSIN